MANPSTTVKAVLAVLTCSTLLAVGACSSSNSDTSSASSSKSAKVSTTSGSAAPSSPSGSAASVSAPPPGNISDTVAPVSVATLAPVPLDAPADFGGGVVAAISGVTATTASAQLPGEIAGPAIHFTVQIQNTSAAAVDLGSVVVNVYDSTTAPAIQITSGAEQGVTGSLAPRATASGDYLFTIPADRRAPVTIEVIFQAGAPVAQFVGNVG